MLSPPKRTPDFGKPRIDCTHGCSQHRNFKRAGCILFAVAQFHQVQTSQQEAGSSNINHPQLEAEVTLSLSLSLSLSLDRSLAL